MPFFCCCRCVTIARSPPQRPMEVHHAQPKRPSRSPVRTPPLAPSNPSSSPSTASALGQPPPAPASAPVKAKAHKHPPTPSPPLRRMVVLLVMLQTVPQSPSHAGNALAKLKSFRAHIRLSSDSVHKRLRCIQNQCRLSDNQMHFCPKSASFSRLGDRSVAE
jgi:hypothetical protein